MGQNVKIKIAKCVQNVEKAKMTKALSARHLYSSRSNYSYQYIRFRNHNARSNISLYPILSVPIQYRKVSKFGLDFCLCKEFLT